MKFSEFENLSSALGSIVAGCQDAGVVLMERKYERFWNPAGHFDGDRCSQAGLRRHRGVGLCTDPEHPPALHTARVVVLRYDHSVFDRLFRLGGTIHSLHLPYPGATAPTLKNIVHA